MGARALRFQLADCRPHAQAIAPGGLGFVQGLIGSVQGGFGIAVLGPEVT